VSTIPPNWLGSILGTPAAQQHAGAAKSKEAVEQVSRSNAAKFSDSLHNVIENSDKDSQAYADSEGLGSQGRQSADETAANEEPKSDDGEGPAKEGGGGIDVQA
jgi:hypothetical protein